MVGETRMLGRLKVTIGIFALVSLAYVILALNNGAPGSDFLHAAYKWGWMDRSGSPLCWILAIGGLLLIGWGLRDLGIVRDDL